MLARKYICSCYFSQNIFLKQYNLHVKYTSDEAFWQNYGNILEANGCDAEGYNDVIDTINKEVERRRRNGEQSRLRKELIAKSYQPLHPNIYTLHESFLHQEFKNVVQYAKGASANKNDLIKMVTSCQGDRVYSLPVFTDEFCVLFLEEIRHFQKSDLPKGRPNSMNYNGVLLEEVGFYPKFFDVLRTEYLSLIASLLYPECVGDGGLDAQRAFIVHYDYNEDEDNTDLNIHFDNAEVTLNVSLNESFVGGELFLGGMRQSPTSSYKQVQHHRAHGVFHRGQHLHGAMPLESGERYNLIIWMRVSSVRNKLCPMCDRTPSLVETEGDGDGYTKKDEVVDV